jgi:surface polysaccharide O-acyltransferase-like enzyme
VLLPLLVAAMIGVTKEVWTLVASLPPGAMPPEALSATKLDVTNTLLEQIRIIVLFPSLIFWALVMRRKDPETHKRLMILATLLPLPAAIDRMTWMPATIPDNPASIHFYSLLWLLPVLIYEIARRGRIHRAYVIGIALNLPFIAVSHFLWSSPWWIAAAPRLMGAQGW